MKPQQEATTMSPRLLDVRGAAAYLGVSPWTLRCFVADGHVRTVTLPSTRQGKVGNRKLLFDLKDLDSFVEKQRHL
jgi:hypothetical protein